jgi:hypothetical protein
MMGQHPRLGAGSLVRHLDTNLVETIVSFLDPAPKRGSDGKHQLEPLFEFMSEQRQDVDRTLAAIHADGSDDGDDEAEEDEDEEVEEDGLSEERRRRREEEAVDATISGVLAELIDVDSDECAPGGAAATRSRRKRTRCDCEAAAALASVARDLAERMKELADVVRSARLPQCARARAARAHRVPRGCVRDASAGVRAHAHARVRRA